MSFSLAALGSLAAGVGISQGISDTSNFLGAWTGNSAKESLNKNITRTNLKYQKAYDLWTQEQDKKYEEWYQNYIYGLQSNEYFNLAKKYGENTAKWAVTGLKNAGLNPILAAGGGFNSNIGDASPSSSSGAHSAHSVRGASVGAGSINSPVSGASMTALQQIRSSAKQMQIADVQSEADLRVKDAQAASLQADADSKSLGQSEFGKNLASVGMLLDSVGLKKPLKMLANRAADWMVEQLGSVTKPTTGKAWERQIEELSDELQRSKNLNLNESEKKVFRKAVKRHAIDEVHRSKAPVWIP